MKWIPFILLLLVGMILDAGNLLSFATFHGGQVEPSFLLIFLVFFALNPKTEYAVISAFAIGFAADVAGSVIGPYTVCYGLAGSLLAQGAEEITLRHPVRKVGMVFLVGVVTGLVASWLAALKVGHPSGMPVLSMLGGAMYSSLVAPLIWPLLRVASGNLNNPVPSRTRNAASLHV